jgi:hypothetical protein
MRIGKLNESGLHAALKAHYAQPGDRLESVIGGFVIDIVREGEPPHLIEIQTGNFSALKPKLTALLDAHRIKIVYPLAIHKWIVRIDTDGVLLARRKSPRPGSPLDIFRELVYIPTFIGHPNLSIELIETQQEEIWRDDGAGSWRRRHWSIADRRLAALGEAHTLTSPADCFALLQSALNADLPAEFTITDVTTRLIAPRLKPLIQPSLYALHKMGAVVRTGKRRRAFTYALCPTDAL